MNDAQGCQHWLIGTVLFPGNFRLCGWWYGLGFFFVLSAAVVVGVVLRQTCQAIKVDINQYYVPLKAINKSFAEYAHSHAHTHTHHLVSVEENAWIFSFVLIRIPIVPLASSTVSATFTDLEKELMWCECLCMHEWRWQGYTLFIGHFIMLLAINKN